MAFEYADGFDNYAQANMIEEGWVNPGGQMTAGRFGGQAWIASNGTDATRILSLGSLASRVIGFAFRPAGNINALATTNEFLRISDSGGVLSSGRTQVMLGLLNGRITVYRGVNGSGGTLLTTSSTGPLILSGLWYYVEVKVTVNSASGSVEINLSDGVSSTNVVNISGANTQTTASATFDTMSLIQDGTPVGGSNTFDDLYVLTLSGAVNNTFLGEVRIQSKYMATNGHINQWTPLSSTNASQIDETLIDNDTTYNSSSTVGQLDLFNAQALSISGGSIAAVVMKIYARKDDVSARAISSVVYDGATDIVNATSHGLFSTYLSMIDVYETDPSTSSAWTTAIFNARQFGVKMLS